MTNRQLYIGQYHNKIWESNRLNKYAISSEGIGEALKRSASALAAAGNDVDESIAMITAGNEIVQDPEKMGTTLKTVSMYLRATKTELEAAGESTEGMAESTSKLRDSLLGLTGGKVDIMSDENTYKNTYQILQEMSKVWDTMTDKQQAAALELMGGKRNANVVAALIENFGQAEAALKTSQDSSGSALKENEKYLDSIAGKIEQFKAQWQALSDSLADSDALKNIIDLGTDLLSLLTQLSEATNGYAITAPLLFAGMSKGLGISFTNYEKYIDELGNQAEKISVLGKTIVDTGTNPSQSSSSKNTKRSLKRSSNTTPAIYTTSEEEIDRVTKAFEKNKQAAQTASTTSKATGASMKGIGISARVASVGVTVLNTALNALIGMGVGLAISALISLWEDYANAAEEGKEATEEFQSTIQGHQDNIKTLEGLKSRYDELSKIQNGEVKDDKGNIKTLNADELAEYKDLQQQIADLSPTLVSGYDEEGNAILRKNASVQKAIDLEKERIKLEQQTFLDDKSEDVIEGTDAELAEVKRERTNLRSTIFNELRKNNALDDYTEKLRENKNIDDKVWSSKYLDSISVYYSQHPNEEIDRDALNFAVEQNNLRQESIDLIYQEIDALRLKNDEEEQARMRNDEIGRSAYGVNLYKDKIINDYGEGTGRLFENLSVQYARAGAGQWDAEQIQDKVMSMMSGFYNAETTAERVQVVTDAIKELEEEGRNAEEIMSAVFSGIDEDLQPITNELFSLYESNEKSKGKTSDEINSDLVDMAVQIATAENQAMGLQGVMSELGKDMDISSLQDKFTPLITSMFDTTMAAYQTSSSVRNAMQSMSMKPTMDLSQINTQLANASKKADITKGEFKGLVAYLISVGALKPKVKYIDLKVPKIESTKGFNFRIDFTTIKMPKISYEADNSVLEKLGIDDYTYSGNSGGGGGGGTSTGGGGGGGSSSSQEKDIGAEKLKKLKHQLNMGKITESKYYSEYGKIAKKYWKGRKKYQDEYWQYEEAYYKWKQEQEKERIEKLFDTLENKLKLGLINEANYWKTRKSYMDKYWKKNKEYQENYIDGLIDYYDYIKDLQEERLNDKSDDYDTVKDTVIGAIDDEIDKLQELNDEKEKENELEEARQRLEDARRQRKSVVYRAGVGIEYVANADEVEEAQKEYDDLVNQEKIDELEKLKEQIEDMYGLYDEKKNESITASILGKDWKNDIKKATDDLLKLSDVIYQLNKNLDSFDEDPDKFIHSSSADKDLQNIINKIESDYKYVTSSKSSSSSSSKSSSSKPKVSSISRTLQYGNSGSDVKKLQTALKQLGYNPGTIDGIFGKNTKSAVQKFQKANKIAADGIVGKNTKSKFRAKGYKSGVLFLDKPQIANINENGQELVIDSPQNGELASLNKGASVFPKEQTQNLWNLSKNPENYMKDLFLQQIPRIEQNIPSNSVSINIGDIQISQVKDANSLANDIYNRFGHSLMQKIYKNRG